MPMATQSRRPNSALAERLSREAWRFEFFQAVRLLERAAAVHADSLGRSEHQVGLNNPPSREAVRFKALPSRRFPSAPIADISASTKSDDAEDGKARPTEMQVTFMGLTGPAGVLPEHYLDLVLERRRLGDVTLREFLDLFNHRTISLFYRAWEKYRVLIGFERAALDPRAEDTFTRCIESLVGVGTAGIKGRTNNADDALVRYSGFFAHRPRSSVALRAMLTHRFKVRVQIEEFAGRWLAVDGEERTRLPSSSDKKGQHNALGAKTLCGNALCGNKVWDVQSHFRVVLGPLTRARFDDFLPDALDLVQLIELVNLYVGPGFDFEVQPTLAAAEVPVARLGDPNAGNSRLGWNAWLGSRVPAFDAPDAHFSDIDVESASKPGATDRISHA